jgi:hypothetical protein
MVTKARYRRFLRPDKHKRMTLTSHQNLLLSISAALDSGEIALAFALRCLLVDKILKGEK